MAKKKNVLVPENVSSQLLPRLNLFTNDLKSQTYAVSLKIEMNEHCWLTLGNLGWTQWKLSIYSAGGQELRLSTAGFQLIYYLVDQSPRSDRDTLLLPPQLNRHAAHDYVMVIRPVFDRALYCSINPVLATRLSCSQPRFNRIRWSRRKVLDWILTISSLIGHTWIKRNFFFHNQHRWKWDHGFSCRSSFYGHLSWTRPQCCGEVGVSLGLFLRIISFPWNDRPHNSKFKIFYLATIPTPLSHTKKGWNRIAPFCGILQAGFNVQALLGIIEWETTAIVIIVWTIPRGIKEWSDRWKRGYRVSIFKWWGRCSCHEDEWLMCKRNLGGPHPAKALCIYDLRLWL